MVLDAQIVLTVRTGNNNTRELLYPARHQCTLPLNNLNFIFESCTTAFNQTSQFNSDRYGFS
jgi:hypothetical protein